MPGYQFVTYLKWNMRQKDFQLSWRLQLPQIMYLDLFSYTLPTGSRTYRSNTVTFTIAPIHKSKQAN
ncbi:hypothetical protein VNO77_43774 [Canavalia gladiata]|uniref:Uncharacterized protein n=1 Tax=Canavalia gladiata TaxID=3824 RepID=A0AAN9JVF3_CANGL